MSGIAFHHLVAIYSKISVEDFMSLIILFPHESSYELLWFENRFLQCMLAMAA
jgi:hypothetical protein